MPEIRDRLARCVAAAVPDLDPEAIALASVATVEGWDSMAAVTLFALVEEEFGLRIAPEEMLELTSFASLLAYVESAAAGRPSANGSAA